MNNGLYNGLLNGLENGMQGELSPVRVPSEIGVLFTDSFSRSSLGSNYSVAGASTFTTDGVKLTVTGGVGAFTHIMKRLLNGTCNERHTQSFDFKMTSAPSGTSYGIGIGIFGSNPNDSRGYVLRIVTSTGSSLGKTLLDTCQGSGSPSYTNRKTSTSGMTISQNDNLRMVVTREFSTIKWSVYNLTTNVTYSDSFTFSYSVASPVHVPHSTGNFCIHSFGGTFEVSNWTVSSKENRLSKVLFIGDSITYGIFADDYKYRWATKTMESSAYKFIVSGGASDKTNEVLTKIDELVALKPKYAVLMIGGNDVFFGVSDATTKANYESIVLKLKSVGTIVIHCFATPRTSIDLRNWNAYLLQKYSSTDVVIQNTFHHLTTTPTSSFDLKAIYDSGDGTHPNKAGHNAIANAVYQSVTYVI